MPLITTTVDARGVATLTLNRPDKHNALDGATVQELHAALTALANDAQARVVVLTGAGASFCAGADIAHMRSMMGATEQQNVDDALLLARCLRTLDELDKPVIARVNGNVFGGGVGLVACADIAIGVETAKFALTEVRLGIVPAAISPYVVAAIGNRHARRLFLTAAPFDALEARSIGLLALHCDCRAARRGGRDASRSPAAWRAGSAARRKETRASRGRTRRSRSARRGNGSPARAVAREPGRTRRVVGVPGASQARLACGRVNPLTSRVFRGKACSWRRSSSPSPAPAAASAAPWRSPSRRSAPSSPCSTSTRPISTGRASCARPSRRARRSYRLQRHARRRSVEHARRGRRATSAGST